jgi:putative sigma-54 modulation protein
MQITVTGRHMGVSDALKEYCVQKADKLPRLFDRISAIEVVLDGKDGQHSAEMIVHSAGSPPFVASEQHDDAFAAVDLLMDKIEAQVRRFKQKQRNRKHPPRTGLEPPAP